MGRGGIRWDSAVAICGNTYYSEETKETCSVHTIVEKFEGVQGKGYSYEEGKRGRVFRDT